MAGGDRIDQRVREIAGRVADSEGIEVVDVECRGDARRLVVRIFIDKPAGVSHADCELVSAQVGTILDVEEVVPGRYTLEVSSPGLDRKLIKMKDFERFCGRKARLKLRGPREGRRQFTGRLQGVEAGRIALELTEKGAGGAGQTIHVEFDDIEEARLVVEW